MRPCQSDEILAHVNALARRPRMMQSEILTAGDLTLDRGRCVLSSNDGEVRLSGKELQLVEMFLREPGQVKCCTRRSGEQAGTRPTITSRFI